MRRGQVVLAGAGGCQDGAGALDQPIKTAPPGGTPGWELCARGPLLPGERESVEAMAGRVCPGQVQGLTCSGRPTRLGTALFSVFGPKY